MLRNPTVLQDFLCCVLPEMKTDFGSLKAVSNELLALHKSGKYVRLDLNLTTSSGELINIEMQVAHEPGFTNRMQFYLAHNYTKQLLIGDNFVKARRAIGIWICNFHFLKDGAYHRDYVLYDRINNHALPESMELIILDAPNYKSATGPLQPWLQLFAANTEDEIMSLATQSPSMEYPCEFVRRMNMTPEERALADAAERDWIDKAILRGAAFEEGKDVGISLGRNEGLLSVAKSMLLAGEPRGKIIQFTKLTEQELDKLQ